MYLHACANKLLEYYNVMYGAGTLAVVQLSPTRPRRCYEGGGELASTRVIERPGPNIIVL